MDLQNVPIRRALFSVSDKEGAVGFAKFLAGRGVEIIATGGTAKKLEQAGISLVPLESITKNPEAFGGRMKTISFPLASALLYRRSVAEDEAMAKQLGVEPIDLVVCNLYPFEEARDKGVGDADLIEEIDIGGPTMVRAAAKNFASVAVCTNPSQYADVMKEIENFDGALSFETRRRLAVSAFQMTANYDAAVSNELVKRFTEEESEVLRLERGRKLRYGENPHQAAVFYRNPKAGSRETPSIASADILQGKALSYNNILDADAAHRAMSDAFHAAGSLKPTVAVVKHLNPCGLAVAGSVLSALELAWEGDPVSAFGGILAFSHEITLECAEWLEGKFVELLVAPSVEGEALRKFAAKKNLRILLCPPREKGLKEKMIRSVFGGVLLQDEDVGLDPEFKSVTKVKFSAEWERLAQFGVMACKHLRSNAIALVKEVKGSLQLVGAGMGQPNRIDSLQALAAPRAEAKGSLEDLLLVSDAFFPFPDAVEAAHELGIKRIVQPGGSIKDGEVIAAADRFGIAMAFTGRRHFRH